MKLINIILAIVFIAFAVFQYNDPDPYIWMFVYGVTALLCLNAAMGKTFRLGNITVIMFSTIYMVLLIPQMVEWIVGGMPSIATEMKAESAHVELVREFFGLLITILTMLFQLRIGKNSDVKIEKLITDDSALVE